MIARKRRRRAVEHEEATRTLCALVRCGSLAVAMPADAVTFIAMAEDVTVTADAGVLRVKAGDLVVPAWELSGLLGLDAPTTTWVFLKTSVTSGSTAVALGCGPCLTIQKLVDPDPLPRGVFRAGNDAIIGAFRVDAGLLEIGCGILGIWIDPARLIGGDAVTAAMREEA